MKQSLACMFALIFCAAIGAEPMRTIATVRGDVPFEGGTGLFVEEVFLVGLTPDLKLEVRASYEQKDAHKIGMAGLGFVPVFGNGLYGELYYMIGLDSGGAISHGANAELTWEGEAGLVSTAAKFFISPSADYWYVIPNIGADYFFTPWYALKGKLFGSRNSSGDLSFSLWLVNAFTLSDVWELSPGLAVGMAIDDVGTTHPFAVTAGAKADFAESANVRMALEVYGADFAKFQGVRCSITVDVAFR